MTTGSETSVTFKPLCAILKGAHSVTGDDIIYLQNAKLDNPVITVDGIGGATVDATEITLPPYAENYEVTHEYDNSFMYFAVAPGSVTLVKRSGETKTATVEAGKIYNVAP